MTIQNWKKMDISPKISFIKGKAPKTLINNPEPGYILYLTPELLRGNLPSIEYCSEKESISVSNNEVIILWDGSNAGEIFKAKTGALASTMARINIQSLAIDSSYLFYFLKNYEYRIKNQVRGSGIPHVDRKVFSELPDDFPLNLSEQRKIAEILTTVDDAIEQTDVLIRKYQRIKQGLMQHLLTRGVDANGQLRQVAKLAPSLYKQNDDQWIPNEWTIRTIENLSIYVGSGITPKGGSEVYVSEGVMFIRSQNVTFEGLLLNDVAYIDDKIHRSMCRSEIFPFDVLINITGASIGRCCVFPDWLGRANVNQHVCAIRFTSPDYYDSNYLSYVLSSWIGQSQIDKLNAGGNRQGLNYQQLRSFQIPWPEKNERKIIVDILKRNDELITIEKNNHLKLLSLKQGLMQDLLTGKVRVTALLKN